MHPVADSAPSRVRKTRIGCRAPTGQAAPPSRTGWVPCPNVCAVVHPVCPRTGAFPLQTASSPSTRAPPAALVPLSSSLAPLGPRPRGEGAAGRGESGLQGAAPPGEAAPEAEGGPYRSVRGVRAPPRVAARFWATRVVREDVWYVIRRIILTAFRSSQRRSIISTASGVGPERRSRGCCRATPFPTSLLLFLPAGVRSQAWLHLRNGGPGLSRWTTPPRLPAMIPVDYDYPRLSQGQ